jgi:hypothetical protein
VCDKEFTEMNYNSKVSVGKFSHALEEEECMYDFDGTARRKETCRKTYTYVCMYVCIRGVP